MAAPEAGGANTVEMNESQDPPAAHSERTPIRSFEGYEYVSMDRAIQSRGAKLAEVIDYWKLTLEGVWLHSVSLGSELSELEIDAYLHGVFELSGYQHDIIAQAVNELIDMLPDPPRASFSNEPDLDEVEPLAPDDDFGA